jgi:hypothetical protein
MLAEYTEQLSRHCPNRATMIVPADKTADAERTREPELSPATEQGVRDLIAYHEMMVRRWSALLEKLLRHDGHQNEHRGGF